MSPTRLYQLYDLTAQAGLGPLMSFKLDAPAIRSFYAILANAETLPGQYPDHFELRYLGTLDDETGRITPQERPQAVATGASWAIQNERPGLLPPLALTPSDDPTGFINGLNQRSPATARGELTR